MSLPPLVGLVGRKRVGKDSVAAFLVERHGFKRYAFADALRRAAISSDPFLTGPLLSDEPQPLSAIVHTLGWEGLKDSKYGEDGRRYLQALGMAIRDLDPGFWLRKVTAPAAKDRFAGTPVVVTDVRFHNEADAVEAAGGVLVRVERPGVADGDLHVSETELDTRATTHTVVNSGTMCDLGGIVSNLHEALS